MKTVRGMLTTMQTDAAMPREPRSRFTFVQRMTAQVLLYVMPTMSVLAAVPPVVSAAPLPSSPAVVLPFTAAAPLAVPASVPLAAPLPVLPVLAMPQSGGGGGSSTAVVVGQALSDESGLPVSGATASVAGGGASATSDTQGRYSLAVATDETIAIDKAGFTRVERVVAGEGGTATSLADARLTPLRASSAVTPAGASLVAGRVTVTVAPGAVTGTTAMHLTPLTPQGLPGELPLGWIPLAAFDLRHSSGTAPSGVMGLEVRELPAGSLCLIKYNTTAHEWVAVAVGLGATAGTLTTDIPSEGAFAVVAGDVGPTAPPVPAVSAALAGVEAVELPPGVMGTAVVDPDQLGSTAELATATVTAQPPLSIPSGSLLEARVVETYTLKTGESLVDERRYHDVAVFRAPGSTGNTLNATFSIAPWRAIPRERLAHGQIQVEIWSPRPRARGSVGGSQAVTVVSQGGRLSVPAGSLAEDTSIGLEMLTVSPTLPTGDGLTGIAELMVDLSGKELSQSADLSIEAPGGFTGGTWLIARYEPAGAVPAWVVVSLAKRVSSRVVPEAYEGLPGVRTGGRYAFFHSTNGVGFVDGTIDPAGGVAVVKVVPTALPFVALHRTDATYIVASATGSGTVHADVPGSTLNARIPVTVAALQTTHANLTLQGTDVVAAVWPTNGELVPNSVQIEVSSPLPIDRATVTSTSVRVLKKSNGTPVLVRFVYSGDEKTLVVVPTVPEGAPETQQALEYSTEYQVVGTGVKAATGVNVVVPTAEFRTRPLVSTVLSKKALVFGIPNSMGISTITAAAGSYPPGTTIFVVNDSSADVVTTTVGDNGAVSETIRATLNDRLQVTITDPLGNEIAYSRNQFYDAATGDWAVSSGGGEIPGIGGVALHVPAEALDKPIRIKAEKFGADVIPAAQLPQMPDAQGNNVMNFGEGIKITSDDKPRFKKEVDLVFNKPAAAPEGAFYYVYRKLTDENGQVFYATIDHAFVEEVDGEQKVVTASYPMSGHGDSLGMFTGLGSLGMAAISSIKTTYTILMWTFDQTMPGKALMGSIRGVVRRAAWQPNQPGQAPRPPTYDPVPDALVRVTDLNGNQVSRGQLFAITQSDGRFVIWDRYYTGGTVKIGVATTSDPRQAAEVFATQADAHDVRFPALRFYPHVAEANIDLPSVQPPPPPPSLAIHLMQVREVDQPPVPNQPPPPPLLVRLPTNGVVGLDSKYLIGLDSNNPVTFVRIKGPTYDEEYRFDNQTLVRDELPPGSRPEAQEMLRDYIIRRPNVPFTLPQPGVYTIEAESVPEIGEAKKAKMTFLAIAGNALRRDPIYGERPKIIERASVPRPQDDGTPANGVPLATLPSIQFTEPVRGFTLANVNVSETCEDGTTEDIPIGISGVGSDTFGTTIAYDDVTNMQPSERAPVPSVTGITIKPLEGFASRCTYRLTFGTGIEDLDRDGSNNPAPLPLDLGDPAFELVWVTGGPMSLTSGREPAPGSFGLVVMKGRAYIAEGTMQRGLVRVYDLTTPPEPIQTGPGIPISPRIFDMVGDPESVIVDVPAAQGAPPERGKLLLVATGPTNKSMPSSIQMYDVTNDGDPRLVGASSVTTSAPDGYITRMAVRGQYAYTATLRKGVQIVDLKAARDEFTGLSALRKTQVVPLLNREGVGFGHDAVVATIDVRRTATNPVVGKNLLYDIATADMEVTGINETVLVTTGEFPLSLVRASTREVKIYGDALAPLTKALPAPLTGNMQLVSGDAIAYAKLSLRDDGQDGRQIAFIAGRGHFGNPAEVQPVFAVVEVLGWDLPPALLGMTRSRVAPARDILVHGEIAYVGDEMFSISVLERPKSIGRIAGVGDLLALGGDTATERGQLYSTAHTSIGGNRDLGGLQRASLDNTCGLVLLTPTVALPQFLDRTYLNVDGKKDRPLAFSNCRRMRVTLRMINERNEQSWVPARIDYDTARLPLIENREFEVGLHRLHIAGDLLGAGVTGKRKFVLYGEDVDDPSAPPFVLPGLFVADLPNRPVLPPSHIYVREVNIGRGFLTRQFSDFRVKGRHLSLEMARTFSTSGMNVESPMGVGWAWTYDARIMKHAKPEGETKYKFTVSVPGGGGSRFWTTNDTTSSATFTNWSGYNEKLAMEVLTELNPYTNEPKRRFTYTDKAGIEYIYEQVESPRRADDEWQIRRIKDPHDDEIEIKYDAIGRVSEVSLKQDNVVVYTMTPTYAHFGTFDRISSISCGALGLFVSYEYDRRGNLTAATRGVGNVGGPAADAQHREEYGYKPLPEGYDEDDDSIAKPHLMVRYRDANGSVTEYAYDDPDPDKFPLNESPVTKVWQTGSSEPLETRFSYEPQASPAAVRVTDPKGNPATVYEFTPIAGNPDEEEDPHLFLTRIVRPAENAVTTFGWNGETSKMDWEQDGRGRRVTYEYADGRGNVTKETVTGPDVPTLITQYTYHETFNKLTQKIEPQPAGDTVSWSINGTGDVDGMTNWAGQTIYQWANGEMQSQTAPNGHVTTYGNYHPSGQPRVIAYVGTQLTETRDIDARGRVTRVSASNGSRTDYVYDGLDRLRTETKFGTPGPRMVTAKTYYPGGQVRLVRNAKGAETEYSLNGLNQVYQTQTRFQSAGENQTAWIVTDFDRNGNKEFETDARGVRRKFVYDALDRLTGEQIENNPSTFGPTGAIATYSYDAVGNRLTEKDERNGLTTTYEYDAYSRLTKKIFPGPDGYYEQYAYDTVGNRTDFRDANNKWTYTQYDKLRRPTVIQRPEEHVTNITYADPNGASKVTKLEELESPRGLRTRYTYDALNRELTRVVRLAGAGGEEREYTTNTSYLDTGAPAVTVSTPRWVRTTQLDAAQRPWKTTVAPADGSEEAIQTDITYDELGNKFTEVNGRRHPTQYGYDTLGRLTSVQDPFPGNPPTSYKYDKGGLKIEETDRRGVVKTFNYDNLARPKVTEVQADSQMSGEGWRHEIQYDDVQRQRVEVDAMGRTTTYLHDTLGRVVRITDVNGDYIEYGYDGVNKRSESDKERNETTFDYDGLNRIKVVTNALNETINTDYQDAQNKVVVQDRRAVANTTKQLDPLGRVLSVTKGTVRLELNEYDQDGNKTRAEDASGRKTTFQYDHANRLVSRVDGAESADAATTTFDVDANGNVVAERDGRTASTEWSVQRSFDELNRVESETNGENETTRFWYDGEGNRTRVRQPMEQETTYEYEELGKLWSVTQPHGTSQYAYDRNRNRTYQTDPKSNVVRMDYDNMNRLQFLRQDPTPGLDLKTEYRYDKVGNQTELIDAKGGRVVMAYDDINRLESKTYFLAPNEPQPWRHTTAISYGYDENDNLETVNETVVTGTGPSQTLPTIRVWNNLDRLESETITLPDGGGTKQVSYTYYANGTRETVTAAGTTTTYTYDWQNRLKTVTPSGSGATTYGYFGDGLVDSISYPNGVVATHSYDKADRLLTLNNGSASAYVYVYDDNGNRTSQSETLGGVTEPTSYGYDNSNRLRRVTYPADTAFPSGRVVEYGYDLAGNRETEVTKHPTTEAVLASKTGTFDKVNRLTLLTDNLDPTKTIVYDHDKNGNEIAKTVNGVRTDFFYDVRDKLIQAKRGTTINLEYQHDFQGRLVRSFDDEGLKQYLYDGTSRLAEFYGNGNLVAKYDYGDRLIRLTHATEGQRYYSFDALGSPTALTDELGAVQTKYHLDAWGIYRKPEQIDDSKNRFGFTGYVYQPLLNIYYANARFYDPEVGRFTSQDSYLGSIDDPPSLHRYFYANANPTRYVDPTGHYSDPLVEQYLRMPPDQRAAVDRVQGEAAARAAGSLWGSTKWAAKTGLFMLKAAVMGGAGAEHAPDVHAFYDNMVKGIFNTAKDPKGMPGRVYDAKVQQYNQALAEADNRIAQGDHFGAGDVFTEDFTAPTAAEALTVGETGFQFTRAGVRVGSGVLAKAPNAMESLHDWMRPRDGLIEVPRLRTPEQRARLAALAKAKAEAQFDGMSYAQRSESPMATAAISLETGEIVPTIATGQTPSVVHPGMAGAAERLGGVGTRTACGNTVGGCAEFGGANQLMLGGTRPENIDFLTPFRPRNFKPQPVCANCGTMFDPSQFQPGTLFDPPLLPYMPPTPGPYRR